MKRRSIRDNTMLPDEIGQDSFLDTASNLVGVLIILVVVVGAHFRNVAHDEGIMTVRTRGLTSAEQTIEKSGQTEISLRLENGTLEQQILAEERLAQLRSMERVQVLAMLSQFDLDLAERETQRSDSEQLDLAREDQRRQLERRLADLRQNIQSLKSETTQVVAIDHFPTPIAKTVFRDDVHFRLKGGKIAMVPLEELIQLMRKEWEVKAEKLSSASHVSETVGPIAGFRLQYELAAHQTTQPTSVGPMTRRSIEFEQFSLHPTMETIGEPLDAAIQAGSEFWSHVERLNPQRYTISVWVYPDSYAEFNQLKRWLFDRGFQTATWPLSEGGLISGGPKGHHAMAQ